MPEGSNEKPSSTKSSEEEKKPQPTVPASTPPAPRPVPPPQPAAQVATAAPPKPAAAPPPPPPPSRPPRNTGRRTFVKALVTVGAILSITPFVPWGDFLSHTVGSSGTDKRQKVVIDNVAKYGPAAGKAVNVKKDSSGSFTLFPPDSHWVITYPSSGDSTVDAQNPDTFVKFELIRLPAGQLGGDAEDAAAFVAFSKVCVHLWCSPNYNPASNHEQYECPCHGSIYEVPDGKAVQGPASQQPAPTNAIPMLTLTADSSGDLYIEPPVWDVDHNGVIGYGRNYQSYLGYIKPAAQGSG